MPGVPGSDVHPPLERAVRQRLEHFGPFVVVVLAVLFLVLGLVQSPARTLPPWMRSSI